LKLCERGEDVVALFARIPVPGRVKTRLLTHLTPEQACRLHVASTLDTAELIDHAAPAGLKWIFWSEPLTENRTMAAVRKRLPNMFRHAVQRGGTLGDRMAAVFEQAFASGARSAVIVGSDSPTLPSRRIVEAFEVLKSCDIVLGPADDGGYYLIGCRRFDLALFDSVEWSTARTLAQTKRNAESLGFQVGELERWYDLDEWKDVERLLTESRKGNTLPRHLGAFFDQLKSEKGESASI
jgi:rSAM/selenodomain-associated transferase 1